MSNKKPASRTKKVISYVLKALELLHELFESLSDLAYGVALTLAQFRNIKQSVLDTLNTITNWPVSIGCGVIAFFGTAHHFFKLALNFEWGQKCYSSIKGALHRALPELFDAPIKKQHSEAEVSNKKWLNFGRAALWGVTLACTIGWALVDPIGFYVLFLAGQYLAYLAMWKLEDQHLTTKLKKAEAAAKNPEHHPLVDAESDPIARMHHHPAYRLESKKIRYGFLRKNLAFSGIATFVTGIMFVAVALCPVGTIPMMAILGAAILSSIIYNYYCTHQENKALAELDKTFEMPRIEAQTTDGDSTPSNTPRAQKILKQPKPPDYDTAADTAEDTTQNPLANTDPQPSTHIHPSPVDLTDLAVTQKPTLKTPNSPSYTEQGQLRIAPLSKEVSYYSTALATLRKSASANPIHIDPNGPAVSYTK
ncbi:MAG: hypothetical protein EBX40_05295 [Gammaproteobacteria bacterium]|nr:hypothetical protein [Gammaproteobacteria bacterium]